MKKHLLNPKIANLKVWITILMIFCAYSISNAVDISNGATVYLADASNVSSWAHWNSNGNYGGHSAIVHHDNSNCHNTAVTMNIPVTITTAGTYSVAVWANNCWSDNAYVQIRFEGETTYSTASIKSDGNGWEAWHKSNPITDVNLCAATGTLYVTLPSGSPIEVWKLVFTRTSDATGCSGGGDCTPVKYNPSALGWTASCINTCGGDANVLIENSDNFIAYSHGNDGFMVDMKSKIPIGRLVFVHNSPGCNLNGNCGPRNIVVEISDSSSGPWLKVYGPATESANCDSIVADLPPNTEAQFFRVINKDTGADWNFCMVRAYAESCSSSSSCAKPSISAQPGGTQTTSLNGTAFTPLSVTASGSGTLSYKWYRSASTATTGGTYVGTDSPSYTPLNTATGNFYYYCVVINDCGGGEKDSITSAISGRMTVYDPAVAGTICLEEDFSGILHNATCPSTGANATTLNSYNSVAGGGASKQYCTNVFNLNLSSTGGGVGTSGTWEVTGVGRWTGAGLRAGKSSHLVLSHWGAYVQLPTVTDPDTLVFWVRVPHSNKPSNEGSSGFKVLINGVAASEVYYTTSESGRGTALAVGSGDNTFYSAGNYTIRLAVQTWTKLTIPINFAGSSPTIMIQTSTDNGNEANSILIDDVIIKCQTACEPPSAVTVSGAQSHCQGAVATNLTATPTNDGVPTPYKYQWYSNTSNSNTGGTIIAGATNATYTPSTATAGTTYYYVEVSTGASCKIKSGTSVAAYAVSITAAPKATVTYTGATTYVDLNWTTVSGATGYNVYSCTNGTCFTKTLLTASPLPAGTLTYRINGTPSNSDYYVVETLFSNSCTSLSNVVSSKNLPTNFCPSQIGAGCGTCSSACTNNLLGYVDFSYTGSLSTGPNTWTINDVSTYGIASETLGLGSALNYTTTANQIRKNKEYLITKNPQNVQGGNDNNADMVNLQNLPNSDGIFLFKSNGDDNASLVYTIRGLNIPNQTSDANKLKYCVRIKMRNVGMPSQNPGDANDRNNPCNGNGNNIKIQVRNVNNYNTLPGGSVSGAYLNKNSNSHITPTPGCVVSNVSGTYTSSDQQIDNVPTHYGDSAIIEFTVTLGANNENRNDDGFQIRIRSLNNGRNAITGIESIEVYGCMPKNIVATDDKDAGLTGNTACENSPVKLTASGSGFGGNIKWYKGATLASAITASSIGSGNILYTKAPWGTGNFERYFAVGNAGVDSIDIYAMFCCSSLGENVIVFEEHFDFEQILENGVPVECYTPIDSLRAGKGTTKYKFVRNLPKKEGVTDKCVLKEGEYAIVLHSSWSYWLNTTYAGRRPLQYEHTVNGGISTDGTSGMLMVNASDEKGDDGIFYELELKGLCRGSSYEFSAWYNSIALDSRYCEPGCIGITSEEPSNIKFEIYEKSNMSTPIPGGSGSTGDFGGNAPNAGSFQWRKFELKFDTPPSSSEGTEYVLRLTNFRNDKAGNDLLIDDIVVTKCVTTLYTYEEGTTNVEATVCSSDPIKLEIPMPQSLIDLINGATNSPDPVYIQWMKSIDNGVNWTEVGGVEAYTSGSGKNILSVLPPENNSFELYRAKISRDPVRAGLINDLVTNCYNDVISYNFHLERTGSLEIDVEPHDEPVIICGLTASTTLYGTTPLDAEGWTWIKHEYGLQQDTIGIVWSSNPADKDLVITEVGKATYYFIVKRGYCTAYKTKQIEVEEIPVLTPSVISPPPAICPNEMLTVTTPEISNPENTTILKQGWLLSSTPFNKLTANYDVTFDPSTTALTAADNDKYLIYFAMNHCDTVFTNEVQITVNPLPTFATSPQVCTGATLNISNTNNGSTWISRNNGIAIVSAGVITGVSSGTVYIINSSPDGCVDSVLVKVNKLLERSFSAQICATDSFEFYGKYLKKEAIYIDTLSLGGACDSIITLDLKVNKLLERSFSAQICATDSFEFYGKYLKKEDIYIDTLSLGGVCDSIITLDLKVNVCIDLQLAQTINNVCKGDNTVLTITISNNASVSATDVKTNITLPIGLTYISDNAGGNYASASGVWTIPSIAAQTTASIKITVKGSIAGANQSVQSYISSANAGALSNADYASTGNAMKAESFVTVNALPLPSINSGGVTILTCSTTSITLTASGGGTYTWRNTLSATNTAVVNTEGIYWVVVKSDESCIDSTSISITKDTDLPIVNILGAKVLTCETPSITLTATGNGAHYSWSNGLGNNANATITSAGTYTVTSTALNNCKLTQSITINEDKTPPPVSINSTSNELTCTTSSILLTAMSELGVTYLWNNADASTTENILIKSAGLYTVKVTSANNGCTNTASINLTQVPFADISIADDAVCPNTEVVLNVELSSVPQAGTYSIDWERRYLSEKIHKPVSGNHRLADTPSESAMYYVTLIHNGCVRRDSAVVTVWEAPRLVEVRHEKDRTFTFWVTGDNPRFWFSVDIDHPTSYISDNLFENIPFGKHHLYVKDDIGCKTDTVFILPEIELIFPKFFTPNGDDLNEYWLVENLEQYPEIELLIFDRFSKELLRLSNSIGWKGWDGKYLGKAMPSDDYWYLLTIKETGRQYIGHFTLLR